MTLKFIEIFGYRGFKENARLDFAAPNGNSGSGLTILTGPNNSGKSSVLECLRTRSGHENVSFTSGTRNSSIESVEIKFHTNNGVEILKSLTRGSSETVRENIDPMVEIFVLPSRRTFPPYFGRQTLNRREYLNNSALPPQRAAMLNNFAFRLFNIHKAPQKFNELLKEALGFEAKWTLDLSDQGQHFVKFFNGEHTHSSDGMGEGIVSIFSILDSLYDSSPGNVIVIDEPELSLHPSLQKRLKGILLRYAKDRQIIISTHSPYFVDVQAIAMGAHLARIVTTQNGTKIHQLSSESKDIILALAKNNLHNPHIFGLDARELFFLEERVILTEGQEDVMLFPTIFDQLEVPSPGNFFGWGAGGASNVIKLCTILKDLGFSKVAALFDGDKTEEAQRCRQKFPEYYFSCIPAKDIRNKKARKATEKIEGLLDDNYVVKGEFFIEAKAIAWELYSKLNSF